jgi:hypothetical protein
MAKKRVFRIIFSNDGKVFEIYARQVISGDIYGFVEVQGILFGERTTLVVDPADEQLKLEFNGVNKTYIPYHNVIRIDEVEKEGTGKVLQLNAGDKEGDRIKTPVLMPGKGPEGS